VPADPLADARPGQPSPFVNQLGTVNEVLRSVREERNHRNTTGHTAGGEPLTPACRVLVRNDTGGSLAAFSILTLGAPIISAVDYPHDVRRDPLFPGTTPAAITDISAVTIEPLADGAIGRAVVMGATVCDIDVTDAGHGYATPKASYNTMLASAASGPARIIWKATGTGTKRAVVLIGDGKGESVVFGECDTNIAVSLATDYTWYDSGLTVTLPSAGTYLVSADITASGYATASPAVARISARVYDVTNSVQIGGSFWTVMVAPVVNINGVGLAHREFFHTVTGPTVLRIEGRREGGPTWGAANLGYPSRLAFTKVG
jgi:hypothetical protein